MRRMSSTDKNYDGSNTYFLDVYGMALNSLGIYAIETYGLAILRK